MRMSDWSSDVCSSDLAAREFACGLVEQGAQRGDDARGDARVNVAAIGDLIDQGGADGLGPRFGHVDELVTLAHCPFSSVCLWAKAYARTHHLCHTEVAHPRRRTDHPRGVRDRA